MPNPLHVHVPATMLAESLPFLLEKKLQPEIAFKGPDLDALSPRALIDAGRMLGAAGLAVPSMPLLPISIPAPSNPLFSKRPGNDFFRPWKRPTASGPA